MVKICLYSSILIVIFASLSIGNEKNEKRHGIEIACNFTPAKYKFTITPTIAYLWFRDKFANEISGEFMSINKEKGDINESNTQAGGIYTLYIKLKEDYLLLGPCAGFILRGHSKENIPTFYLYENYSAVYIGGYKFALCYGEDSAKFKLSFRQLFGTLTEYFDVETYDNSSHMRASQESEKSFSTLITFNIGVVITF